MNIYADIGNSSTVFGFSIKAGQYSILRIDTQYLFDRTYLKKKIFAKLKSIKKLKTDVGKVVICSVVPRARTALKKNLKSILPDAKVLLIGSRIKPDIVNKYRQPKKVGLDRLVNALAVKNKYSVPALVVDFGTAITIDAVSKEGEYLGGVIIPGINLSLSSLHKNTALLPKLKAQKPEKILGRDTKNSILSGIFYGYACLVDGLIDKLIAELWPGKAKRIKVIATGGHLYLMKNLVRRVDHYDPELTIKGIEIALFSAKKRII